MLNVSVIICTRNPNLGRLKETLMALRAQNLPVAQWELLVIDNASDNDFVQEIDISWHQGARVIREDKPGLIAARLRGVHESAADLLVFVDDDNLLDPHYLQGAIEIGEKWPILGAWGGRIDARFDEPPPEWTKGHWDKLTVRDVRRDVWGNYTDRFDHVPSGAGLCIRKSVAQAYEKATRENPIRLTIGTTSGSLGCEDLDTAMTACDMGLGTGMFTTLKLTHIIPPNRLAENYLLRVTEDATKSGVMLQYLRGHMPPPRRGRISNFLFWLRLMKQDPRSRRFSRAKDRAVQAGARQVEQLVAPKPSMSAST